MFIATIKNNTGQGLLETVIALGIITSGIVGAISLAVSNQASSDSASDRLAAINLAREGVEVARGLRDSNWLARAVWDQGLESGADYSAAPLFDKDANTWTLDFTADAESHNHARLWRQGGVYFQSAAANPPGATLSPFRRLLRLDEICADKTTAASGSMCDAGANPKIGIRAQATVSWESQKGAESLTVEERIFNWR